MSLKVEDIIFLYSGIFIFTGLISHLGVSLYFAYTKIESMLEHLKQCPCVMDRAWINKGGDLGTLSIENLNTFPSGLKRQLVFRQWTGRLCFLLMLILLVLRKTGVV